MSTFQLRFRRVLTIAPLLLVTALPALADRGSEGSDPDGGFSVADLLHLHVQVVQVGHVTTDGERTAAFEGESAHDIIAMTERALKEGSATERYVFDSPVVAGEALKMTEGLRLPFVHGRSKTDTGAVNTSISYEDVGCKIQVQTAWADPAQRSLVRVAWDVSISEVDTAAALVTENATAPIFSRKSIEAKTLSRPGEAIAFRVSSVPASAKIRYTTVLIARLTQNEAEKPQR